MPKFPFTNYHELNLDWILKKVEALFSASEENARTIRTYDTRLTRAEQTATNAETAATSAQQLADAAAANADNALSVAGTADAKADSALTAATDASSAVSGALTIAQEAQQTAGAAVATANDAAATAAGLESLANTANQNATAAVETAGTAVTTANNAAAAAQTADQKAVAAQQTADTNAGNIATLQTTVETISGKVSDIDNKADVIISSASGSIASFADGANDIPIKSLIVNIEPVQAGTGDPSPDNIRPISGHTGASVEQRGKNLMNMTDVLDNAWINTVNTNIGSIDGANVFYADVPKNTTVTYSADKGNRCVIAGYKTRPSTIIGATYDVLFQNGASQLLTKTFDTGDCEFVSFYLNRDQANKPTLIQLELGSTATAFEPYQGNQLSITFPSEAGTVYGGTLDVTNGVLTVDRAMVTVDGSQVPIANLSNTGVFNTYETVLVGLPTDKIEMYMSSRFKAHINSGISYMDNEFTVDDNKRIMIKAPNLFSTVNEANAYFVENPTQFVGLIQNPVTYQLTPQELDTLLGANNIWTDVGTVDVQYPADTKLYIDGKIAELQALVLEN